MKFLIVILLALASSGAWAGGIDEPASPCTPEWYRFVERQLGSGDGHGHGPDLGSDEWKGVIEFKLGIRGQPDLPGRETGAWCELIDRLLRER